MLERKELARPPEACLHLVDAEERPVAAAQLVGTFQIPGRGHEDAVADDRLHDEQRHVLTA